MSVEDSDMRFIANNDRIGADWCRIPSFIPYPIQQAGSYERERPRKTPGGTVGFSVAETISLAHQSAASLWFSCIRGWSSRAMTHPVKSGRGDVRWDNSQLSQCTGTDASHTIYGVTAPRAKNRR